MLCELQIEVPVFFPHRSFAPLPPSVSLPFLSTKQRGETALVFWKSGPGSFPASAALASRPITDTREQLLRLLELRAQYMLDQMLLVQQRKVRVVYEFYQVKMARLHLSYYSFASPGVLRASHHSLPSPRGGKVAVPSTVFLLSG